MKLETFYYGFAIMLLSIIKKKSVPKRELKKELNRIVDEMYKTFDEGSK